MMLKSTGLAIFILLTAGVVLAQPNSSLATSAKKKELSEIRPWSIGFDYSGSTDLMIEKERPFEHELNILTTYKIGSGWALGAFAGMGYEAIDSEVVREEENPGFGDSGIGISKEIKMTQFTSLNNKLTYIFPTSSMSKTLGLSGIVAASVGFELPFRRYDISFSNEIFGRYFLNSNDTAIRGTTVNPSKAIGYGLAAAYSVTKHWVLVAGGAVRTSENIEGDSRFKSSNYVGTSVAYGNFVSSLALGNGDAPDLPSARNTTLDNTNLQTYDEYRQIVSWSLSCKF